MKRPGGSPGPSVRRKSPVSSARPLKLRSDSQALDSPRAVVAKLNTARAILAIPIRFGAIIVRGGDQRPRGTCELLETFRSLAPVSRGRLRSAALVLHYLLLLRGLLLLGRLLGWLGCLLGLLLLVVVRRWVRPYAQVGAHQAPGAALVHHAARVHRVKVSICRYLRGFTVSWAVLPG